MATIRPNDNAPAEEVHYTFSTAEFDLGSGGSYDSDDPVVVEAAEVHPWLEVEYPEAEEVYTHEANTVSWKDDPFSQYNDHSNDPDLVNETEHAKDEADGDDKTVATESPVLAKTAPEPTVTHDNPPFGGPEER